MRKLGLMCAVLALVALAFVAQRMFAERRGSIETERSAVPETTTATAGESRLERDANLERDNVSKQAPASKPIAERAAIEAPPPSITLLGSVRDLTGRVEPEDLRDMEITFTQANDVHKVLPIDGKKYVVEGLRPGRVNVRVRARGFRPLAEEHKLAELPLEQKLNLYLDPLDSLWIRLETPDGKDLMEAIQDDPSFASAPKITVVATQDPPGATLPLVEDRRSSEYASGTLIASFHPLTKEGSRAYSILSAFENLPMWMSACRGSVVLGTLLATRDATEVVIPVSLEALHRSIGSLHFRIVDADTGRAVDDARADVVPMDPQRALHRMSSSGRIVRADEALPRVESDVLWRDLEPESYLLRVSAREHELIHRYVRVDAGNVTDLGSIALAGSVTIDGEVVATTPLGAGVQVEALELDGDRIESSAVAHTCRTAARGRFKLDGLGRRRYMIRANGPSTAIAVDASQGDVHDVKLHWTNGVHLTLRYDDPPDPTDASRRAVERSERMEMAIFDADHLQIAEASPLMLALDMRSSFLLPPGSYTLEVVRGAKREEIKFELTSAPVVVVIPR